MSVEITTPPAPPPPPPAPPDGEEPAPPPATSNALMVFIPIGTVHEVLPVFVNETMVLGIGRTVIIFV